MARVKASEIAMTADAYRCVCIGPAGLDKSAKRMQIPSLISAVGNVLPRAFANASSHSCKLVPRNAVQASSSFTDACPCSVVIRLNYNRNWQP